ncbi:MAG: thioredoxin family protein [Nanoarchaeota archaeon]
MEILILGPGCTKCKKTEEYCRNVVAKLGIKSTVTHEQDIRKFADYGVMLTPAVVIDGKLTCQGKVPTEKEIEEMITAAEKNI